MLSLLGRNALNCFGPNHRRVQRSSTNLQRPSRPKGTSRSPQRAEVRITDVRWPQRIVPAAWLPVWSTPISQVSQEQMPHHGAVMSRLDVAHQFHFGGFLGGLTLGVGDHLSKPDGKSYSEHEIIMIPLWPCLERLVTCGDSDLVGSYE